MAAAGRVIGLLLVVGTGPGFAQVVPDGKFGTTQGLPGPNYSITADLGTLRGNNLFHSFTQFDLKAGDTATFSGPASVRNVLSRVTGGGPSSIDGAIRSSITGANFYFVNPSGIVFGPNAVVDVSGSFAATTAHYLQFADGTRFMAALDADDSLLSSAPISAFGFLEGADGPIEVHGAVKVGPDTSLSFIGTRVVVAEGARLEAPNGSIHLTGTAGPGELAAPATSLPGSNQAISSAAVPAATVKDVPGNTKVVIRGGRLVVDNASIDANTSGGSIDITTTKDVAVVSGGQVITSSSDLVPGGDIVIRSPSILIDGLDGGLPTRIAAETFSENPEARGGNIVIESDSLELRRGAEISVSSFGTADAGRVDIHTSLLRVQGSDAPQFPTQISANAASVIGAQSGAGGLIAIHAKTVEIGNGAGILAATTGDANAGSIVIESGSLTLMNGGVTTFSAGAGAGGDIRIDSDQLTLDGPFASITALTTGLNDQQPAGAGGIVNINAGALRLLNDSAISANTFGDGRGGNVNITANSLTLDRATFQPGSIPGITASSNPSFFGEGGGGKGGDISVSAGTVTLNHGMTISTTTATSGDGGSVQIKAGTVTLEGSSTIQSASLAAGRAGTLSVEATGSILLTGNSTISTSAPESSGGDIRVNAGNEIRLFNSKITSQAGPDGGGNTALVAPQLIYLLNSTLTAQALGDGGNLDIDPVFFILNKSGLISKSSTANGGNITILSDYFFQSSSEIDASAPFGLPGTVSVSAPEVNLSGSLIGLPSGLLGAETQLRPDCGVRLTDNFSSFIVVGRGGLPIAPGGFVPSTVAPWLDEKK